HDSPPVGRLDAVVPQFLEYPTRADTELHPPVRQDVERRDLLRRDQRIPLGDQRHRGTEGQPGGGLRRSGQRHEAVHAVLELRGPRGDVVVLRGDRRDMGVVGVEQRLEAAVLQQRRELTGPDGVPGGEHNKPELHDACLPVLTTPAITTPAITTSAITTPASTIPPTCAPPPPATQHPPRPPRPP